ncbi:MAG: type II secretion system protein GspE, partial [Candidatus Aureabacteria bacterium]|nr:type II secretion system protein GspE [Candidatus Auribacterota bacterium]
LVRRICQNCKAAYPASEYEMKLLNLKSGEHMIAKGQGCPSCNHTGYKGRFGIFELMLMGPDIQDLVYARKTASDIRMTAIKLGMRTLREDAIIKVLNGSTSIDELLRVTKIGET